jgi:hypothetical protein
MKKSMAIPLAFLAVLFLARSAHAQQRYVTDAPGFDLGLRLGYAIPFGDIDANAGNGLASAFSGAIPFVLEGGYRFNQQLTLGALFQYGFAQVKDGNASGCGGGVSCSGSIVRLGIEGIFHFPNPGMFAPWAGAAIGYEWMGISASGGGLSTSAGASGIEFLTLQGGAEYRMAPQFTLGPFASLSFARYGTVSVDNGTGSVSTDISDPALHEWLQLGVRGSFNL